MNKLIAATIMLLASLGCNAAVVLTDGDSFSASFDLISDGDFYKETDNYWEALIPILDSNNPPFSMPSANTSHVTLTLFENTNFTNEIFSETQDTSNWSADFGIYFFSQGLFFEDRDGSLTISYSGPGEATLIDNILVANFAGTEDPSGVAYVSIVPDPSAIESKPVPAPAGFMLFGASIIVFRKYIKK